ncbi:MAG: CHASE2 domain-containing protein [Nitrospirae bacterium]|nr:CHASE2 domain-containing protein [Nitrospirota bacterium]
MLDIIRTISGKMSAKPVRGVIIGLCAGGVALILGMFQFADHLELYTLDLRYRLRPPIKTLPSLGYIDFDDESLREFGQWPWPRLRHANLVNTLGFYNAKAAAFDVFFVERENTAFYPAALRNMLHSPPEKFLPALDDSFRNYDEEFAAAMNRYGNIYLSYYTLRASNAGGIDHSAPHSPALSLLMKTFQPIPKGLDTNALFSDTRIDPPLEEFIEAAKGAGYAMPDLDSDAIIRHYTLLRRYGNSLTYPVVLTMLSNIMDFKPQEMRIVPGDYITLKNALIYGSKKRQDVNIPIDSHCQMPLNWAGKFHETYTHIPYDTVSYFSAVIRAKQVASKYAGISYTELRGSIYSTLMEDALVPEVKASAIAAEIAAALFVSKYLEAGMAEEEIHRQLKPYIDEAIANRIYTIVTLCLQTEKALSEHSPVSPPAISHPLAAQIAEARKNMIWFFNKGRLSDAYPYYFPEAPSLIKQGKRVTLSPVDMEGMIFMIGLTATNSIDLNPTPYEPAAPMVSFHLNAINSILTGQFLYSIPAALSYAITLGLAVVIALTGIMSGVVITSFITAAAVAAYTFHTFRVWIVKGYRIDLVVPLLGMAISYVTVLVVQFVRTFLERKKLRSIFAQMVSPSVLKAMEANPDSFSLTGVRKAAAVFFSALNGMNEAIRNVSPDELPGLLSIYLSPNSEIIMHYGGYIDKYEGHVIMADFGVPIDDELSAARCAFSAIEQRLDFGAFKFYAEAAYSLSVSVSMGFNYGYVSAGNMGSEGKFQYTVMGDPVNVAARFMAANLIYNSDYAITGQDAVLVISEFVHLRLLDKLLLKGKTRPLTIYECLGWQPEAYLKLNAGKPVPAHIKALWMRCPTGKILGYLHLWDTIQKKTAHPLAKTIWRFFDESLPVVQPLLINKWKGEAIIFHRHITAFKHKLKEAHGQVFSGLDFADKEMATKLPKFLSIRQEEITRVIEMLDAPSLPLDRNLRDELLSASRSLLNKCKMLLSRLSKERFNDKYIGRTTEVLRGFITNKELANEHRLNALIADGQRLYVAMVEEFYKKLAGSPAPWHEMMSMACAPTEAELGSARHFEEALNLYWGRHWDMAIEAFQKALKLMPHDTPAQSFINRIELYKKSPPSQLWQGEFIQTNK